MNSESRNELADLLEQLGKEAMPAPWHHRIEAFNNYVIISDFDQPAHFSDLASGALAVAMRNALPEIIAALRATPSETATTGPYTQVSDMLRDALRYACIRDRLAIEDVERAFEDCPMGSTNIDPEESKKTDAAIDNIMEAYKEPTDG